MRYIVIVDGLVENDYGTQREAKAEADRISQRLWNLRLEADVYVAAVDTEIVAATGA